MQDDLSDVRQILVDTVKGGDGAAVEALVSAHPDLVDTPTGDGLHPVVLAVYYGKKGIADLLVRHGAHLSYAGDSEEMGRYVVGFFRREYAFSNDELSRLRDADAPAPHAHTPYR